MAQQREVRVVEIVGMASGAVAESGPRRRRAQRGADHRAQRRATLDARDGAGDGGHGLARTREHHADRVERSATHLRARGLGTVSELHSDDELGKTLRGGGHGETIANASRRSR